MLKKLYKLKANRGFTIVELVVVVAIIAILTGTIIGGTNTQRKKILAANDMARDFYSAIQTEFTNFQMYDGPLTMTLNAVYNGGTVNGKTFTGDLSQTIEFQGDYSGIKYFPSVGGNYPIQDKLGTKDGNPAGEGNPYNPDGETHREGKPASATIYIELQFRANHIDHIFYSNNGFEFLLAQPEINDTRGSELCAVLMQEMPERMSYEDGYYYAKISYRAPTMGGAGSLANLTANDFRATAVTVDWAAYSATELVNEEDYTFKTTNMSQSGHVLGIHASMVDLTDTKGKSSGSERGTTGTALG